MRASLGRALCAKIDGLRKGGASFDDIFQTRDGQSVRVAARAVGMTIVMQIARDGGAVARLKEAEAALRREREELRALRAGLRSAGVAIWTRGSDDASTWTEQSQSAWSPTLQRRLIEAAVVAGARRIEGEDEEEEESAFEVARLADEGDMVVARRVDDLARVERMTNRLLKTMSDTFAHLSVGLMIFDDRRRLSLFNPRILEIFGEDAGRLAARPRLDDLLDRWRADGRVPERLDYAEWKAAFCDLESIDEAAIAEETWHIADGRSLRALRRRHPSGGLAIVVEDVTESVSLRRSSASERAVRSLTTDMLSEGIAVAGPDGRFRMTNLAFRRLWAKEDGSEFKPHHVRDFLSREDLGADAAAFWGDLLPVVTGGADRQALERQVPLEDYRIIQPRISTMPDGSTLIVFSDVTASEAMAVALKQRNEAFEHAEDMRAALVDQISHQLRTPLNSIFGFAQILSEERFGSLNDEQREYAMLIVASAADLTDVVDEMADLISIAGVSDKPERLNPMALLKDVANAVAARFASRGTTIELGEINVSGEITVERLRFRQLVFNALVDALTRTTFGEAVRVSPSFEDGLLCVRIEHLDRENAFDRGLAFALAQRAALLCDGELSAEINDDQERVITAKIPLEPTEVVNATRFMKVASSG
ncbi:MAG: PAS-domain containing protein [Pseudomonadota bacterium]